MNNRGHLPAGQMPGGGAPEGPPGVGVGGGGRGRGGRPPHLYGNGHPHPYGGHHGGFNQPMYPGGYMPPYGGPPTYYMPPYQNGVMGAMGSPNYGQLAYSPTPAAYPRSPPAMSHQQYAPMAPAVQNPYARIPQSPVVASNPSPYPPTAPSFYPPPPHTPSSTHSFAIPTPLSPAVSSTAHTTFQGIPRIQPELSNPQPVAAVHPSFEAHSTPAASTPVSELSTAVETPEVGMSAKPEPFHPTLPWFSTPDKWKPIRSWKRQPKISKKTKLSAPPVVEDDVNLVSGTAPGSEPDESLQKTAADTGADTGPKKPDVHAELTADARESRSKSPANNGPEPPITPSSGKGGKPPKSPSTEKSKGGSKPTSPSPTGKLEKDFKSPVATDTGKVTPAVPKIPPPGSYGGSHVGPEQSGKTPDTAKPEGPVTEDSKPPSDAVKSEGTATEDTKSPETAKSEGSATGDAKSPEAVKSEGTATEAAKPKPVSWSALFATPTSASASKSAPSASQPQTNGSNGRPQVKPSPTALAETLLAFTPNRQTVSFLEPQGLKNLGNTCYMNSVLQALIFSPPFHDFLREASATKVQSMKSTLLDAMIEFANGFKVVTTASTAQDLKSSLKQADYKLPDKNSFIDPDFLYKTVLRIPQFQDFKPKEQQDAHEFLILFLESLHEECAQSMSKVAASTDSTAPTSPTDDEPWVEMGPRQRATVTRHAGEPTIASPVKKIFGFETRSELKKSGGKHSVTVESHICLPLDIARDDVYNIVDAMRIIPLAEKLEANETKQVYMDSIPEVLILQIKRFGYRNNQATKFGKNIGYPLEFEIPQELLSRRIRSDVMGSIFKYRLTAVVYHHGASAHSGHYTAAVCRQDGSSWIRLDDKDIIPITIEDVVASGAEDKSKASKNGAGWKTASAGNKKGGNITNGTPTMTTTKSKDEVENNGKVAYLLFYQRV